MFRPQLDHFGDGAALNQMNCLRLIVSDRKGFGEVKSAKYHCAK